MERLPTTLDRHEKVRNADGSASCWALNSIWDLSANFLFARPLGNAAVNVCHEFL